MSMLLSKKKIMAAINRMSVHLHRRANRIYNDMTLAPRFVDKADKAMTYRLGSDRFAKQHPGWGVTLKQKKLMYDLHMAELSFREIEGICQLAPHSGNGAARCINDYKEATGIVSRRKPVPRMTQEQKERHIRSFAHKQPAVFMDIVATIPKLRDMVPAGK